MHMSLAPKHGKRAAWKTSGRSSSQNLFELLFHEIHKLGHDNSLPPDVVTDADQINRLRLHRIDTNQLAPIRHALTCQNRLPLQPQKAIHKLLPTLQYSKTSNKTTGPTGISKTLPRKHLYRQLSAAICIQQFEHAPCGLDSDVQMGQVSLHVFAAQKNFQLIEGYAFFLFDVYVPEHGFEGLNMILPQTDLVHNDLIFVCLCHLKGMFAEKTRDHVRHAEKHEHNIDQQPWQSRHACKQILHAKKLTTQTNNWHPNALA